MVPSDTISETATPPSSMAESLVECEADETDLARKKRKKKKRRRRRKNATPEEISASRFVHRWLFPDSAVDDDEDEEEKAALLRNINSNDNKRAGRLVFELHSHSTCSDGFLSPAAVVERAYGNGVKVLALTDHDTMAGIPQAIESAHKFGIRLIPGVEISASYYPREEFGTEEPVHILAYYSSWGPAKFEELEGLLAKIRDGRYIRAKEMLSKLNKLNMPLKLEHVSRIAGNGVALGRLHVARAMVEAGYVENLKQAFNRYLYDGGPAYATGSEPDAEDVVKLVSRTGGVSALAHPWALKNPISVIKDLKSVGLHAIEAYRSDGKLSGLSDLADAYQLVKIGGSDFHGRTGCDEPDLGSVHLPVLTIFEFLKLAQPIWCSATKEIISGFSVNSCDGKDFTDLCISSWLVDKEERDVSQLAVVRMRLSHLIIDSV